MARFVRSPDVVARRIAGEVVLVPIATRTENAARRTANFYVLNTTAELLWDRLQSPADAEELTREVALHFEMDAAEVRGDVEQFLSELERCGAIHTAEPT
jgi:hypothetical protein